ncbi:MAG: 4-(cytidine 5'-diphospho)-2-C-methyl-D-erythritol kinase [Desulfobacterales bacterium]|nr:4-(cytidine 5'-diphospho)-2-C-methyl-D-erythritol kinase [Desulfobacterales bacterium]
MGEILSPAKINLFLHVTGKRPDGYHELYSLMAPIDLCDYISMEFQGRGIRVVCGHPRVPEDKTNLVCRAASLFAAACKARGLPRPYEGVEIRLQKNIPVGGGLGGGSSNAAMVLLALNEKAGNPLSPAALNELGAGLGADVPFFLGNGPAYVSGIGEQLRPCRELPEYWLVLCSPGVAASTVKVFKKLEFGLTFKPDYIMNTGSNLLPIGQELNGREELHNDLEDPACRLYPEIGSTKNEMALLLKRNVYMSGSGSSLFALYSDRGQAEDGFDRLSEAWAGGKQQVFLSRIGQNRR